MPALPGTHGRRRIYLLRHGDVNYYKPDGSRVDEPDLVDLTEEGRAQAGLMAKLTAEIPFDRALHTGMKRTIETAEIVLAGRAVPLGAIPELREIRTGPVDAVPPERIDAEFIYGMETAAEPGARFARGEAYADFYARITAALQDLLVAPGWTRLLLVAHGGTNRAILSWITRGGLAALSTFEQDTCCLNVIDTDLADGEILRRYVRLANFTPYNHSKHGHYLTTLERTFAERGTRG